MDQTTPPPLTDNELHALVDDQVTGAERAALEARLELDAQAQATVAQWHQQRHLLRGLHRQVLDEPVPSTLITAAHQTNHAQQTLHQWWRWGGMAAGVVLAFGMGWLTHGEFLRHQPIALLVKTQPSLEFVHQASVAHAVYSPEVRHPVEVTAAEQAHLVQWLSKRVGRQIRVPQLSGQGYELVGGRLLPGEAGARAQFMFQNAAGTRITLYLGALNAVPGSSAARETAFNFSPDGPVPSFYWVDQGFGYALAGAVPHDVLMALADAVYRQL